MTSSQTHDYTVALADLEERPTAVVKKHVHHDAVATFLRETFGEVAGVVQAQGLRLTGAPFGCYVPTSDGFDVEAGFPVSGVVRPSGSVEPSVLPGGHVAHTLHQGAYDAVVPAYQAIEAWIVDNSYESAGPPWEMYLDGPDVAEPRTEIFWPIKPAHR